MKGQDAKVLYLDFDGVLHHENCHWHPKLGACLIAPAEFRLFQHAELLATELNAFPDVLLVLSTSWVLHYGYSGTVRRLPEALRQRCIGATFHSRYMRAESFRCLPRGMQVLEDVERRKPASWIALDDSWEGWPSGAPWIQTDPYEGISIPAVIAKLQHALVAMHAR